MGNREHPRIGAEFEVDVQKWFENRYGKGFSRERTISSFDIGNPPKPHRFDVVSEDRAVVIECKCITWTETGNVPSAKMAFVNQAVFYLSFITDANIDKYVVIKKSEHKKRNVTLAEYYHKTNKHLLGDTKVLEYDKAHDIMREIGVEALRH